MEVGESSSFIPETPHFFKIMLHESIQSGRLVSICCLLSAVHGQHLVLRDNPNFVGVSIRLLFLFPCYVTRFTLITSLQIIPKKFVRKYGTHLSNSGTVLLMVPTNDAWRVELRTSNGSVWLEKGWLEFLNFYSIKHGDFLVFRHRSGSCSNEFDVVIFDNSSTEIEYPVKSRMNSSEIEEEMENICEESVTLVEAQVHLPSRRITSRKSQLQHGSCSTSKDNVLSNAPSSCSDNPAEPTSQGGTDALERGKSGKGLDSSQVPRSNPMLKLGSLKLQGRGTRNGISSVRKTLIICLETVIFGLKAFVLSCTYFVKSSRKSLFVEMRSITYFTLISHSGNTLYIIRSLHELVLITDNSSVFSSRHLLLLKI